MGGRNIFALCPGIDNAGNMLVQNITTGAASATATNAMSSQTYAVMLNCTADCWVIFSNAATPAATATNGFLLQTGDTNLIMGIKPGQKIAAIQSTAGGTLNILELTH